MVPRQTKALELGCIVMEQGGNFDDDGGYHIELLGFWTFSIVQYSRKQKTMFWQLDLKLISITVTEISSL
jgi:hypothetical protein